MFKILKKVVLNPTVTLMEIEAPLIAKKAEPLTESCYTLCSKAKTWGVEVFDKIKGFFGKG